MARSKAAIRQKHPAIQYIDDVLSGNILVCKWVRLAVQRHIDDLSRWQGKKDAPYYFDEDAAQHVIDFFSFLRHSKGKWAGQPFLLEPWQQFILWVVFGWKRSIDDCRRFRTVYIEIARKNGKSTYGAGSGLYMFFADGEQGAECLTAATKKEQAAIVHSEATRMVRSSPSLNKRIGIFKNNLHIPDTASKFVPLGADSKTEDGLNVHFALIDEYHAHPNAGMYDVLRSGMGARTQPMMWIITTAGFEKYCACYDERSYLTSILEKIFNDESYFGIIFTIDDGDKWDDEKVWIKANPNLGLSVNLEDMRDMCRKAQRSPSKQNEFKTKKLNIWTETLTRWIAEEAWALCNFPVNIDALKGRKAYGAFDLSTTTDLTAWVLCFPPIVPGGKYQFLFNFYCPQEDLDLRFPNKNMLAVIRRWIEEGYIVSTPGNVIDYDFVEQQIRRDAQLFDIQEIPFDPYNATQLVNNLMKEGFEDKMVKFSQGIMNMSGPAKNFETKVLKQELAHGNNPVMNWMVACTEVYRDANANIKPVKPDRAKSEKRIDGVIASIMALDRAVKGDSGESIYEYREPMMV